MSDSIHPTAELSVDELILSALELARLCLHMDVGFIAETRNGRRRFEYVTNGEGNLPFSAGDSDALATTYCQRILDRRLPALLPDSHLVPELLAMPVTALLGIRAHIGVPIQFSDGSIFGTFCCYSHLPNHTLDSCEVDGLHQFAALIGRLMEKRVLHERELEEAQARIQAVMDATSFSVVFQPIVELRGGRVVGYEALSRFQAAPERTPDLWFQEAHLAGLGEQLEIMAMEVAVGELPRLPRDAYLSLNVSPQTILNGSLARLLDGWPLDRLMLEVTEHSLVFDYAAMRDMLAPWRRRGLRLAVDDAGSGYASFRHILQLKPDVIKLDQSLIRDIDSNADCRSLAAALVHFAHETGADVVAEGVETAAEMDVLEGIAVRTVQGFLVGRPGPLPDSPPQEGP